MVETKIADVIVPELFTQYVLNKTAKKSALWQSGIVGVETDRDSLSGSDILINRRHFVLHPRGIKWAGAMGVAPNNAGLSSDTNWERVYDPKQIRIVAFKHKVK